MSDPANDAVVGAPLEAEQALVHDSTPGGLRAALEAVLMVIDEPAQESALAAALEVAPDEVAQLLQDLSASYDQQERGFMLRRFAGGWRIYSRPEYAAAVEKFLLGGAQGRLSQAALETLAVIAYRQPISRARIGAIRGVSVDGVTRTLVARGLIREIGQDGSTSALLYGTTDYFLQRMGLESLDELPALAPYLPSAEMLDELAAEGLA
ncbi:SMC-Scp complex subunit ScpB [Ornithinimicrobium sp. Arc0846-15]|nr:SMC-Scp complex subunit ScpB [Ornithinimicrobium laminariae]